MTQLRHSKKGNEPNVGSFGSEIATGQYLTVSFTWSPRQWQKVSVITYSAKTWKIPSFSLRQGYRVNNISSSPIY
jgi:hypothetical protein